MANTIRAVQPDVVMVELCPSRISILSLDEKTLLKEASELSIEKMRTIVKQVQLSFFHCYYGVYSVYSFILSVKHIILAISRAAQCRAFSTCSSSRCRPT